SPDLHTTLKEGARAASPGAKRTRIRRTLVVGQVALAMVLIVTTGELVQLVIIESHARWGFDPRQVLTVDLSLSGSKYADPLEQSRFFESLLERIQGLPGVQLTGATQELPESFPPRVQFELEARPAPGAEDRLLAAGYFISPDYLRVMRIPLLRGRQFSLSDADGAPKVAI